MGEAREESSGHRGGGGGGGGDRVSFATGNAPERSVTKGKSHLSQD